MIVKTDPDTLHSYLEDSSNLRGGHAERVVIPQDIDEVSAVMAEADAAGVPVTISGGGTGTTGSRIPFGGTILSLERLARIVRISNEERIAVVQTGVSVDDLKRSCEERGLFYASHPTESAASAGGTVATNASGARSFKYGPTRSYIRRLTMVLPSGEVLEVRRGEQRLTRDDSSIRLRSGRSIVVPLPTYRMPAVKNAAGYFAADGMDAIDLFIGQEGTLSVVTEIEIGLIEKPSKIVSAFVFFKDEESAWSFAAEARSISRSGEPAGTLEKIDALSIEYFDSNAVELLRLSNPNVPQGCRAAIFFEQDIPSGKSEDATIEAWVRLLSLRGISFDETWVAMNEADAARFTKFRYAIPEAVNEIIRKSGTQKLSTDIAVPDGRLTEMMRYYRDTLAGEGLRHVIFGHIGESHVHVNILPRSKEEAERARGVVLAFVRRGVDLGGTVSAEHGIGKIKHRYLEEMYGKQGIIEMARIKKAFDPNCILGLDTMFPRELLRSV